MNDSPYLKILLLADYGASGGTRTYVKQLLALYAEKHVNVTLLRIHRDEEIDCICEAYGFDCFELSDIFQENNIAKLKWPLQILLERKMLRTFVRDIGADIVVASVGAPERYLGATCLSKHSLYILHTYPSKSDVSYKQLLKRFILPFLIPGQTKVLTVSEYSKQKIIECWGLMRRADNVSVVYSTMGPAKGMNKDTQSEYKMVLTVGHVVDYKNPYTWLRMAIEVNGKFPEKKVHFVWVGDGILLEEFRDMVNELGASNYISFVGHKSDVDKYYRECDIYVQPSRIESLGLSVIDALRHGIPCIVSNTGGLPEVVVDGETGWIIDSEDFRGFANCIESLLLDSQLRELFGQNALERYEAYFSARRWSDFMWSHHTSIMEV
jgi:glycosyltransferase involved in cell wall biosynthesis